MLLHFNPLWWCLTYKLGLEPSYLLIIVKCIHSREMRIMHILMWCKVLLMLKGNILTCDSGQLLLVPLEWSDLDDLVLPSHGCFLWIRIEALTTGCAMPGATSSKWQGTHIVAVAAPENPTRLEKTFKLNSGDTVQVVRAARQWNRGGHYYIRCCKMLLFFL